MEDEAKHADCIKCLLTKIIFGERGEGQNKQCDAKFSGTCPCSHHNTTALIKQISLSWKYLSIQNKIKKDFLPIGRSKLETWLNLPPPPLPFPSSDVDPGFGQKTDLGLCTSNERRVLKFYWMNILDNFKASFFVFILFRRPL